MAKRKKEETEVVEETEVAEVSNAAEAQEAAEYEVKEWAGLPLYVCSRCKFDTFSSDEMLWHLIDKHNSESALKQYFEGKKE